MSLFSGMKFSRKIFLAVFGTSAIASLVVCVVLYGSLSSYRSADFKESYIDHMNLLANALGRIEESQSHIAASAALNVKSQDQIKPGKLTQKELQDLALNLGVSQINIYSGEGFPLQFSGEKPGLLYFAGLVIAPNLRFQTSLIRNEKSQVGQHTLISSFDNKRIIEVVMYFDDVTQLLKEMALHDEDNLSIELFGGNQESLGLIRRPDFTEASSHQEILKQEDGVTWEADKMIVLTSMEQKDETKNYRLVTTISTQALVKELNKIKMIFLATFVLLLLASALISNLLTNGLVKRIESLRTLLGNITRTQDYSSRVQIKGHDSQDEITDLGKNLNHMLETLQSHQTQLMEAERDKARSQVAAQVAHDIRSPLMSMNMALAQIESAQIEPMAILKSAVARLAGIVQKLSAVSVKPEEISGAEAPKLTLMEPLIVSVVNEYAARKRADQKITLVGFEDTPKIWSVVQVIELQTAISNLLNNAFEAGASEVTLRLSGQTKEWRLEIQDNGQGMSPGISEKIFERSFTHGKKTGTGLGLFQAKTAIEWCSGRIEVQSAEKQGTTFTLHLPQEKKPSWLPTALEVKKDQVVCFVDDDKNVLDCWMGKVSELGLTRAHFFRSISQFEEWKNSATWSEDALLVTDQNLNENKKGLELMAELSLGRRAYLCTSDFDEKDIQDQVKKLQGYLIPKPWISQFKIQLLNSK